MLISGREATRRLQAVGSTERGARQALAAGLAGDPTRLAATHLYAEKAVEALAARLPVDATELRGACPHGLFVARRAGGIDDLVGGWPLSLAAAFWVRHLSGQHGFLPLVATVSGFVTTGADITAARPEPGSTPQRPREEFSLRPPGAWFDQFRDRRLPGGPGPSWLLLNVRSWG